MTATTTEALDTPTINDKPLESLPGYLDGEFAHFRRAMVLHTRARFNALDRTVTTRGFTDALDQAIDDLERVEVIAEERYRKLLADTHTEEYDRDPNRISNRTLKALMERWFNNPVRVSGTPLAFTLEAVRNNLGAEISPTTVHFDASASWYSVEYGDRINGDRTSSFSSEILNPTVIAQAVTTLARKGTGIDKDGLANRPFRGLKVTVEGSAVTVVPPARLSRMNYRMLFNDMSDLCGILNDEAHTSSEGTTVKAGA